MWIEDSGRIERIQIILLMITVSVTQGRRVHKQHMVGRESYLYNGVKYRPYKRMKRKCPKEVPWVPTRCLCKAVSQRGAHASWCHVASAASLTPLSFRRSCCHCSDSPHWKTRRPLAMGWHGVANATPRQQYGSFLPPLGIFYNFLLLLYLCSCEGELLKFWSSSAMVFMTYQKAQSFLSHTLSS